MALWRNRPVDYQQNNVSAVAKPQTMKQKLKHLSFLILFYVLIGSSILFILGFAAVEVGYHIMGFSSHVSYKTVRDPADYDIVAYNSFVETDDGESIWISDVPLPNGKVPKACVIILTGIQQPSVTSFYSHAKFFQENGYSSVLMEVRGHGESSGDEITFAYKEHEDVEAVVEYIQKKYPNTKIVLFGMSMGGAVVLNSFGRIEDIDGVIAMSAYSSWEDACMATLKEVEIPDYMCNVLKVFIRMHDFITYGVDSVKNDPVKQVKNHRNRPVFLVHASGDYTVPIENFYRNQESLKGNKNLSYWVRDTGAHFIVNGNRLANITDDVEYCQNLLAFLEKYYGNVDMTNPVDTSENVVKEEVVEKVIGNKPPDLNSIGAN